MSDYLSRGLNQRVADLKESNGHGLEVVMRQAAAAGRLASGNTLREFTDTSFADFEKAYLDAQQFAFNLTGSNEAIQPLDECAQMMINVVMEEVTGRAKRLGIDGTIIPNTLNVIHRGLHDKRNRLTDDFQHGIRGSERLKKDPLVSVINTQSNSPGAIQQVGIGDNFSQNAYAKNHQELINVIDRAMASQEFVTLTPQQQEAFADTATVVKEEAAKAQPDVGRLKRWGTRLGGLAKDLGMNVAATEIFELLKSMFGGS
jgi:hypothetical protein